MKNPKIHVIIYTESEREISKKNIWVATYARKRVHTMTNREFFVQISAIDTIPAELREFAVDAIAKLDHTNETRKAKNAEKAAEKQLLKAPVRNALFEALSEEPKTATELCAAVAPEFEVKPASIPSLMRPFVENGSCVKVDVKVPGKGTQRGYVRG